MRPCIPREVRAKIKKENQWNWENLLTETAQIREQVNKQVNEVAFKFGRQHSVIANLVYKNKTIKGRAPNYKNAWNSLRMSEVNHGKIFSLLRRTGCLFRVVLGPGNYINLSQFQRDYGHEYHTLSMEKREEYLTVFKSKKEARILQQNTNLRKVGVSASADVRTTTRNLLESTTTLPERAGYAIMSFGARTDYSGTAHPFDAVPPALEGFFEKKYGVTPGMIAMEAETWMLTGGASITRNAQTKRANLGSHVAEQLRLSFCKSLLLYII